LESKINRITDILRRDDGISGAMMYTEQISWILFLKFLHDFEDAKADEALLNGQEYTYILDDKFKWSVWACPKDANGKLDLINAKSGEDLLEFVNKESTKSCLLILKVLSQSRKMLNPSNIKSVLFLNIWITALPMGIH